MGPPITLASCKWDICHPSKTYSACSPVVPSKWGNTYRNFSIKIVSTTVFPATHYCWSSFFLYSLDKREKHSPAQLFGPFVGSTPLHSPSQTVVRSGWHMGCFPRSSMVMMDDAIYLNKCIKSNTFHSPILIVFYTIGSKSTTGLYLFPQKNLKVILQVDWSYYAIWSPLALLPHHGKQIAWYMLVVLWIFVVYLQKMWVPLNNYPVAVCSLNIPWYALYNPKTVSYIYSSYMVV